MYANIRLFVMGMVMGHGHMTRMLGRLSAVRVQSVRKRGYYGDGGGLYLKPETLLAMQRQTSGRRRPDDCVT